MSPLRVEIFRDGIWSLVGETRPNDPPRSISNNLPNGTREIYQFYCSSDDSHSIIRQLDPSFELAVGRIRLLDPRDIQAARVVATLRQGDQPFEMQVKTDKSPLPRRLRFTHY